MPKGVRAEEQQYYQNTFFRSEKTRSDAVDLKAIVKRPTQVVYESHHMYPTDFFFIRYNGQRFVGRKTLSPLNVSGQQKSKKCPLITAPMILGLFAREQVTEKGVIIFYKPFTNGEKLALFNEVKTDPTIDIHYPFPYLNKDMKEHMQSLEYWNPVDAQVANLNAGEEVHRQHTIELLKRHDLNGKKLYDPACSTGKFLGSIKETYPQAFTIGQDLHPGMVDFARHHSPIDQLIVGDSLKTPLDDESVDYVFFRFLNCAVVTSELANQLFIKLANKCRNGGYLIVFGHSPVLLSAEWFEFLGLEIIESSAYSEKHNAIYPYYFLRKVAPVPTYSYEQFCVYNQGGKPFSQPEVESTPTLRAKL